MGKSRILFSAIALLGFVACSDSDPVIPAPPEPPVVEPVALARPQVKVDETTENTVSFSWTLVEHAASYEYIIRKGTVDVAHKTAAADATGSQAGELEAATSYELSLRAVAAENQEEFTDSEWSTVAFSTAEAPQPTHVIFADKVLESYILKMEPAVDADGDGIVSFEEAAAVTAIDLAFEAPEDATPENTVSDLSGLEHFTSLAELNLKYHRVTDASPIEGLSSLTFLNLGENPLASLDLANLSSLTDLRLYGTKIAELDLTATPLLKALYLQRTSVTKLDLSVLPDLEEAYINDATLTELKAVHLDKLTRLDAVKNRIGKAEIADCALLSQLHLNGNRLTGMTFRNLPKLMILNLYDNALTSLDVKELPFLLQLFVFDNQLTELDLSGNAAIRQVYATNNPIREMDFSANENLEIVELQDMSELEVINLKNDAYDEYAEYYIVEGNMALKKVVVDPGAEFDHVSRLFKDNPAVSVVTQ